MRKPSSALLHEKTLIYSSMRKPLRLFWEDLLLVYKKTLFYTSMKKPSALLWEGLLLFGEKAFCSSMRRLSGLVILLFYEKTSFLFGLLWEEFMVFNEKTFFYSMTSLFESVLQWEDFSAFRKKALFSSIRGYSSLWWRPSGSIESWGFFLFFRKIFWSWKIFRIFFICTKASVIYTKYTFGSFLHIGDPPEVSYINKTFWRFL